MQLMSIVQAALVAGKSHLWQLKDGREVEREGGAFGELGNDTELRGDKRLGEFLADYLAEHCPFVERVTVEGLGERASHAGGRLWVTIDPIDGSLNYQHAGDMAGFPFSACITVLENSDRVTFGDVVAAGVIDLRRDLEDIWLTERTPDGYATTCGNLKRGLRRARTLQADTLDIGKMNLLGEMYYPDNREQVVRALRGKKGWLRSPGSAAYEMASVASGQAVATVCNAQKQHELGAGFALVLGAGGVAVDWDGRDLHDRIYEFNTTQTPMILAANRRIAEQLIEQLNRN